MALKELVPAAIERQIHFTCIADKGNDVFRIFGKPGAIKIAGNSNVALLTGVNWYLKYVAHGQISTNGDQLNLPAELPAPRSEIEIRSPYRYRYAFNENVAGYSTPYWRFARWQHELDLLAASGVNTVLIERGTDLVLYQTFRDFGYTDKQIRDWITLPAHQNWQLMGNMCCFGGPISMQLLKARAKSARRIFDYMRSLGITPVFPGYYGIVPPGLSQKYPQAHVIPQGEWAGFHRPDWLDPRDPLFRTIAADFYRHQRENFGDTSIYDMEIFQEGGTPGDVPVGAGSAAVQRSLEAAHPGASWMMMAWWGNPKQALLNAVDRSKLLVIDEQLNRDLNHNPEVDYKDISYLYCSLLGAGGGRNKLGAHLHAYAERVPQFGMAPSSHMEGIAYYPEGLDTDPAAFAFFTELGWHTKPVDILSWFSAYAERRYGGYDPHADRAWQIIVDTAYHLPADIESTQGSVFNSRPGLPGGAGWTRYNPEEFESALSELLAVAPKLRESETYQYDLVNITRQILDNRGHALLMQIKAAYEAGDQARFGLLRKEFLHLIQAEDNLLATNRWFLLGPWLEAPKFWASNEAEKAMLEYDARSLLTTWGDRKVSGSLADYANKDWSGLLGTLYYQRWSTYFDVLDAALKTKGQPTPIDWFEIEDRWNHQTNGFPLTPHGDAYQQASDISKYLQARPAYWSATDYIRQPVKVKTSQK